MKRVDVHGYELLFRDSTINQANIVAGDTATAQVIRSFIEFGFDELVGEHPAFINLTRNFILD
jgi:c-di-GMP-related signal transduction protein